MDQNIIDIFVDYGLTGLCILLIFYAGYLILKKGQFTLTIKFPRSEKSDD